MDKITDLTEMTPNMWELYRLIEKSTKEEREISTIDISNEIPYYKSKSPRNSKIYDDVFLINNAFGWQHDKYIITNNNKFKLATYEEIINEYVKIKIKFRKLNIKKKSLETLVNNNGQYKLLSKDNRDINDTKGNKYIESFSKK